VSTGRENVLTQFRDQPVFPPSGSNVQSDNIASPSPEGEVSSPSVFTRSGRQTQKPKWHDDNHVYK